MLVILSGVSGAGKDTIKKEIIKRMKNVISLPSFTSREPREGEEEGIQYRFSAFSNNSFTVGFTIILHYLPFYFIFLPYPLFLLEFLL